MKRNRLRADRMLVELGHFESRARAQDAIRAGLVHVNGTPVARASDLIDANARIEARAPHPYVSRGGLKLAAGLDAFGIDPSGRNCLDVGASTGGFTDVLLKRGAASVLSIDVGRDQLHVSLRADPRVTSLEGADIRTLDPALAPTPPSLAAIDVSFISLRLVLPAVVRLLAEEAWLVALIKPQFEVGRQGLGRGGLVRDPSLREVACADIHATLGDLDITVTGLIPSPIEGGDGNHEFLIGGHRGRSGD